MLKKVIFASVGVIIAFACAFTPVCFAEDSNNFENAEYYETRNFDVDVNINEKNEFTVKERIVVDFTSPRHGIFRYIPMTSTIMREVDGKNENFPTRTSINNVKVDGYKFSREYENGNLVLKIGDADTYVDGRQEYNISYTLKPHDDRMSEYDEVYFNVLPGAWPTPIDASNFNVTLPKAFDKNKVKLFSGDYGNRSDDVVKYTVDGNTVKGQLNEKIPRNNSVTLRVELPNGYFTSQKTDKGLIGFMWVIIIACPIIIALLWFLFGRDETYTKPVTVMPPQGMTPAEVGYIVDETVDSKDVISLLFYWADKGYISIADGAKNDFILTKLKPLPFDSKTYEHTMFDRLFRDSDTVLTSDLSGMFFTTLNTAKAQVSGQFKFRDSTRLYTKSSKTAQVIATLLAIIPIVAATVISAYVNVSDIVSVILAIPVLVITLGCYISVVVLVTKWHSMQKSKRTKDMTLSLVIIGIAMWLLYLAAVSLLQTDEWGKVSSYYMNTVTPMLYAIAGSLISLFFATIMKKRTQHMNEWYSEILGLKQFIEYAEKERLEMLVNENPSYFFNIMPYAYVLGVSDKWAKNFENIAIEAPQWYSGNAYNGGMFNTYMFMHMMNNSMHSVQQNLSVPPAPKGTSGGGSGWSGGGGFSSGGGIGGGGGGSW